MKYYKLITGFNVEDYIEIDETELEKAEACFLQKKDGVFSGGAIRGSKIEMIKPDYHRMMGWNRGYKLGLLDYDELSSKGLDKACQKQLAEAKDKVLYLIETDQLHLIGKPLPKLENNETGKIDTSALVKKMTI
jgi:hypothetical protein